MSEPGRTRVLHVISTLDAGGAETVLYRLCTSSRERGADIVVSLTDAGVYGERLRAAGNVVVTLAMPRRRVSLGGLFRLIGLIRRTRPDVVQTWMYHGDLVGGLAATLAGRREVVWSLHNSNVDPRSTPRSTRWTLKACTLLSRLIPRRIVSCSLRATEIHVGLGYPKGRVVTIPHGYDGQTFMPDRTMREALRRQLGLSSSQPAIGLVARFHPQKDVGNLLDAIVKLRSRASPICVFAGTGMTAENTDLAAAIAGRGLCGQVRLLGPRSDVPAVMNAIDLLVLCSAYGEAFPNVVAEAMACGTPCVATDVGDAALIIGDTGWVVPPRDSTALARAIGSALEMLRDPVAVSARRAACRERIVSRYDLARMAEAYETVWRQVACDLPLGRSEDQASGLRVPVTPKDRPRS